MISRLSETAFRSAIVLAIGVVAIVTMPTFTRADERSVAACAEGFAGVAHSAEKTEARRFTTDLTEYENGHTIAGFQPDEFNRGFLRTTTHDLHTEEKYFRQMIKDRDPQIAFLRELGFRFDYQKGHTIPSMADIKKKYLAMTRKLVEAGMIREDQVLKPARIFEVVENGRIRHIAVDVTAKPPKGARELTNVTSGEDFLAIVAQGYWPIGELRRAHENHISHAFHDLAHFGAFIRNPEFMAAVSDFAKARVANPQLKIQEGLMSAIFENLSVGKRSERPRLTSLLDNLGFKTSDLSSPLSYERTQRQLASISDDRIEREITTAYAERNELIDDIGGLRADGPSKLRAREATTQNPGEKSFLLENPKSFLEQAYDAKTPAERREHFARYLAAMDHTTRMSPADWLRDIARRETYPPTSSVYHYVCHAGVFNAGDQFFEAICR